MSWDKKEYLKQMIRDRKILESSVHLQGIGRVDAKKIKEFKVGERLAYNFGSTAEILKKEIRGKSIRLTLKEKSGMIHKSLKKANTLWAIGY